MIFFTVTEWMLYYLTLYRMTQTELVNTIVEKRDGCLQFPSIHETAHPLQGLEPIPADTGATVGPPVHHRADIQG